MIRQFLYMVLLTSLTGVLLLMWDSPPESFLRPQAGKVDQLPIADSYMENITSHLYSTNGQRQSILQASRISFFSDQSQLFIEQPSFLGLRVVGNSGRLAVVADNSVFLKDKQTFEFNGKVNASWQTKDGQALLKTNKLSYQIEDGIAKASGGSHLQTPQAKISGSSLTADYGNEVFTVESKVRAIHETM